MPIAVCPADRVDAPAGLVWDLLTRPADYGQFWDFTVDRVVPPGRAAPGQRIEGRTRELCREWRIDGEILDVDAAARAIRVRMSLPLGVASENRISCTPLDDGACVVRFG